MSKTLADLVTEFNKLSKEERTQFRDLIVQADGQAEIYGEITDEDIEAMGQESFRRLDEEKDATQAR